MSDPVLFISHGAPKTNKAAIAYKLRKKIHDAFEAELRKGGEFNWLPFMDDHWVAHGQRWRPIILSNLAACQGAVILLDDRARASRWVMSESISLLLRSQAANSFPLQVVEIDDPGVTAALSAEEKNTIEIYDRLFEPFQKDEILKTFVDKDTDLDALVDQLVKSFAAKKASSGTEQKWISQVSRSLYSLNEAVQSDLRVALLGSSKLDEDQKAIADKSQLFYVVAKYLYLIPLEECDEVIKPIKGSAAEICKNLAKCIFPMWAQNVWAAEVQPAINSKSDGVPIVLVVQAEQVGKENISDALNLLLRRVGFELPVRMHIVAGLQDDPFIGDNRVDEAICVLGKRIQTALRIGPNETMTPFSAKKKLTDEQLKYFNDRLNNQVKGLQTTLVCLLGSNWLDEEIIKGITNAYPNALFMIPQVSNQSVNDTSQITILNARLSQDDADRLNQYRFRLAELDNTDSFLPSKDLAFSTEI